MRRPLALAIPVTALAAIALAGCGGGDSSAVSGMSATQIVDQASANTAKQQSYHVALALKGDATAAKGVLGGQAGAILSQPIDVSGEGTVQKPGSVSLDLSTQLGGSPLQVNVTKVGAGLYVSVLGQAVEITLPPDTAKQANPTGLATSVAGWVADPQIAGEEDLDGVPVVHVTGGIDAKALASDLTDLAQSTGSNSGVAGAVDAQAVADVEKALAEDTVDLWVGTGDMLIHKASVHVKMDDSAATADQLRGITVDFTAALSDFGTTQQVTPPQGARKIDLGDAGSLLGA